MTDPPYNVGYTSTLNKTIQNDKMHEREYFDFLHETMGNAISVLKSGGALYMFYASSEIENIYHVLKELDIPVRSQLVWVKKNSVLSFADYMYKHEPCIYAIKGGGDRYFAPSRTNTTILGGLPSISSLSREALEELVYTLFEEACAATDVLFAAEEDRQSINYAHPTIKPVRLIAQLIINSSRPGETVLDIFGGSGSTLMACEEMGRVARIMEIDPKYGDVILKCWEDTTGKEAKKI